MKKNWFVLFFAAFAALNCASAYGETETFKKLTCGEVEQAWWNP